MKKIIAITVVVLLLTGCSSIRIVDEYVNTEMPNFQANKVLVVGLTPDGGLQREFEYSLVKALKENNIIAVKSVDYFESTISENNKTEENLSNFENELLAAGFDAVLFSKVTGQENKVSITQSYRNISKSFETFSDYYYENKPIQNTEQTEDYPVYNTETSLYCLCPGVDRDLIWRGKIDIIDPPKPITSIREYVSTLLRALKKNKLLIVE
ncbi:lipoprotein [Aequorivita sp. Q41]|uniref:lipoprotein n=1 Tax=Aequorivita sp. Q41 TaxID=3153300 RepID=UPI0032427B56